MDRNFISFVFIVYVVVTANSGEINHEEKSVEKADIVKQQGIRITELEETVKKLVETITYQQGKIDKLNYMVETFKNKFEDSVVKTDHVPNHDVNVAHVESHVDANDTRTHHRERRLLVGNGQSVPYNGNVAFYAYISLTEKHVGLHQPLLFDTVKTNIGNGYNGHTGAFIAPQSGIYVFICTIFPDRKSNLAVHMLKNNEIYSTIYGEMMVQGILSGSTGVIVVPLNVGDDVTIRSSSTLNPTGGILSDGNMRTSFAGWKIADYQ